MKRRALVTGASSGIGRALAEVFAENGHDLILVARDRRRLAEAAGACRAKGAEVVVIAQDLSLPGAGREIFEETGRQGLRVDVLVNNAGFGSHGRFCESGLSSELAMVAASVSAVVELTKLFLPPMLERGAGGILNVGSVYCFSPVPFQAVYAATKAFLLSFSQSLAEELADTGVTVSLLAPGITRTEFRRRAGIRESGRLSGMDPKAVALAGYQGLKAGRRLIVPGAQNKLFVGAMGATPAGLRAPLVRAINRLRGLAPAR